MRSHAGQRMLGQSSCRHLMLGQRRRHLLDLLATSAPDRAASDRVAAAKLSAMGNEPRPWPSAA